MKLLRRILPLVLATITLTLAIQVHSIPPPSEGPVRSYPTEFPLSEPSYTSKRPHDFSPFEPALVNFSAERRRMLDGQLLEATVPKMQEMMKRGEVTAEELVVYYADRIRRYDVNHVIREELADEVEPVITLAEYEGMKRDRILRTRRIAGYNRRTSAAIVRAQNELALRKWRVQQQDQDVETDTLVMSWRNELMQSRKANQAIAA